MKQIRKMNKIVGYYTPAFFELHVGTNNSISNLNNLNDRDFSIFLHEYMHFIQDFSTFYGLNNMYVNSEYMHSAVNQIYLMPKGHIVIPIEPFTDNRDNVLLNSHLISLTMGDTEDVESLEITNITNTFDDIDIPNSPLKKIESICVEFRSDKEGDGILSFGAIAIMENMAYLMEQLITNDYETSPDYPYSIVEKVISYIYPEFGNNKLNTLALCDLSLQYSNPGKILVEFLREIKSTLYLPGKPEDLYDIFYARENVLSGKTTTLLNGFENMANTVLSQTKKYFNDPRIFKDINDWISILIKNAIELRQKNKYFLLDIARGGNIRTNKSFKNFIDKVGTPLLCNDNAEFSFYHTGFPNGVEIAYFKAIGQIMQVLGEGKRECDLCPMCHSSNIKIDIRCCNSPWERSHDLSLCTFALFWKHWKLKDYIPQ